MLAECQGRWDGESGHLVLDHDLPVLASAGTSTSHLVTVVCTGRAVTSHDPNHRDFHMCRHSAPCPYRSQGCRKPCIAPRPQDGPPASPSILTPFPHTLASLGHRGWQATSPSQVWSTSSDVNVLLLEPSCTHSLVLVFIDKSRVA